MQPKTATIRRILTLARPRERRTPYPPDARRIILSIVAACLLGSVAAHAQGTAFTYQGSLTENGGKANGLYQLRFTLHNASTEGGLVAGPITNTAVLVSNGLLTTVLDFGDGVFRGNHRWLELGVATNGENAFTSLSPRQEILATPYAMTAAYLSGPLPASALVGAYSEPVSLSNPANVFLGDGGGLTNVHASFLDGLTSSDFWRLNGNSGTTSSNFLGTTDNRPLELRVNNITGFRLEPGFSSTSVNVVGGSSVIYGFASGTTIGGGTSNRVLSLGALGPSRECTISGGLDNQTQGHYCAIGGGTGNSIGFWSRGCVISGGRANTMYYGQGQDDCVIAGGGGNSILRLVNTCTISGGTANSIGGSVGSTLTRGATIGGGMGNSIQSVYVDSSSTFAATISGGQDNSIFTTGREAIAGGSGNIIDRSVASVISGGDNNVIAMGSLHSVVGGGQSNTNRGAYATIPGGDQNVATNYAFAAGHRAKALDTGSFVWADSQDQDFPSSTTNEVSFRCSGGVRFTSGSGDDNQTVSWTPGSGSWSFSSDRNLKEGFTPVDSEEVLERVSRLPVTEWNYRGYPQRHVGPVAQDFHSLFPLNESEKTINSADVDGITLAAIQGLYRRLEAQRLENESLRKRLDDLQSIVSRKGSVLNKVHSGPKLH